MKNKSIFTIGIISLVIFIGIAAYLWYIYFNDYESKLLAQNEHSFAQDVELINSGAIDYINATNQDNDNIIPAYYFRIKNNSDKDYSYVISFENTTSNDGCTVDTTFNRDELLYELKLDNKVIQKGSLNTIRNNVLDTNIVSSRSINDYSLRVWLKEDVKDYANKHFHYVVNLKEKK